MGVLETLNPEVLFQPPSTVGLAGNLLT
jgi:hypothetical protein